MKSDSIKLAAASILSRELYMPAFISKLASYGIPVKNQQEALAYCTVAWHLRDLLQRRHGFVDPAPTPFEKAAARLVVQRNPHIIRAAKVILKDKKAK